MEYADLITLDQAKEASGNARIASLEFGAFSESDIVNLILQRSEIIRDQERPNSYIKRWIEGDSRPLVGLINRLGADELLKRAAAFIYLEYLELLPVLRKQPPKKAADIGCGYAFFDLFLARDFDSELFLIDLETNDHRHFGFEEEGAAYSNLSVAGKFLTDNGVRKDLIHLINPDRQNLDGISDLDYVFSFISCGFHYPWQTYQRFFQQSVHPGGSVVLDIRRKKSPAARAELADLGRVRVIDQAAYGSAVRVMLTIAS